LPHLEVQHALLQRILQIRDLLLLLLAQQIAPVSSFDGFRGLLLRLDLTPNLLELDLDPTALRIL
jgi:hypothetical protein